MLSDSEINRLIVDQTTDYAFIVLDADGIVRRWNSGAQAIFGFSSEEAIGSPIDRFFTPEDRAAGIPADELKQAREEGRAEDKRWHERADGSRFFADGYTLPMRDANGLFHGFVKIARDATTTRIAEERLWRTSESLRALQAIADVSVTDDADSGFGDLLEKLAGILNCDTAMILTIDGDVLRPIASWGLESEVGQIEIPVGEGFAGVVAREQRPMVLLDPKPEQLASPALRASNLRALAGVPICRKGGMIGVLHVGTRSERTFEADELRLLQIAADRAGLSLENRSLFAAERHGRERAGMLARASELLAASLDYEESLRQVVSFSVPDIADWCAIDIIRENGLVERLAVAHVDRRKVRLAHELHDNYPPDLSARQGVGHALRTGESQLFANVTDQLVRASARDDDHYRMVTALGLRSLMIVPLAIGDRRFGAITFASAESGRIFSNDDVLFAEDLARRAALSIENARLYGEAQESNRAKDEFLASVSHELRTPMTAIIGWSKLLRMGADEATTREALDSIEKSAAAQAKIVDDLLDVSRISVGKLRFRVEQVDLRTLVESAARTVAMSAQTKGIDLRTDISASPTVSGDAGRLEQVVLNLLTNALKFTPSGGVVTVGLSADSGTARIRVRDTGAGIPADFLPRIFQRFQQVEMSASRSHGGLGLGLSIVRHLVALHGGNVDVRSEGPGKGAEFIVELPIAITDADATGSFRTRASDVIPSLTDLTILLVEDDEPTRRFLESALSRSGATIVAVGGVDAALQSFDQKRPDVIVTDLAMPQQTGFDLLGAVRARGGKQPAMIALSASGKPDARHESLAAGFDEYLRKPIDPMVLLSVVKRVADASARKE
jgi:PAS domain S-box-containing protein